MAKKTQGSLILVVAALGCVLAAMFASPASAQVTIDRFVPAAMATDGFILERPERPGHMQFAGLLYLEYANDPVVWETILEDTSSTRYNLVSDQLVAHPNFSLGLWNTVLAFVQLPVNLVVTGDEAAAVRYGVQHDTGGSLGAFKLGGRVHIFGETEDPVGLAAQLTVGLPLADWFGATSAFGAESSATGHLQAIGEFRIGRARIDLNAGFRMRKTVEVANLRIGNEFTFALGGSYPLVRGENELRVFLEGFGSSLTSDFGAREQTPFEALTGVKFHREAWTAGVAGDLGLTSGYGSPYFRVLGMIGWASGSSKMIDDDDADADGIIDSVDRCVNDPEDKDGFEDADGCPDLDDDKDGIPDAKDKCPKEAEDKDGFKDDDGCPDPDNDDDGILDANDQCPQEAEDIDGIKDDDGCPEHDKDHDGIEDSVDQCPNEAEDKDGFKDDDGCPDLDNDNDGVPDATDQCPQEAETMNGVDDTDGCPDLVRLDKNSSQIVTLKPVRFETNKAIIHPDSYDMLEQVVSVLKSHPEIVALQIEGHTDAKGNAKKNLKLSGDRANSVREFLIKNGIAADRLGAAGMGSQVPIADNKTEEGRARNRRVEFNIVGIQQ